MILPGQPSQKTDSATVTLDHPIFNEIANAVHELLQRTEILRGSLHTIIEILDKNDLIPDEMKEEPEADEAAAQE